MKRSYDILVPVYDGLVRFIYGTALRRAQTQYLSLIPASSRILIAGGGTGWILEEITRIHQHGLYIDYVDISIKMITKAKERQVGGNEVHFINQSVFNWQSNHSYDVVITPFFFDNFSQPNAQKAFAILNRCVKENGLWLYTDFQVAHSKAYWQKALLFIMYKFFRLMANIEATQLPDILSHFQLHRYKPEQSDMFFHRFIITSVYKKLPFE